MSTGAVIPDEAAFRELARHRRVVPVTRRLLADGETPVGVYRKLAGGPGSFLLESAEQGTGSAGPIWSRYSFIGVRSAATLIEREGQAVWLGTPPPGVPTGGDPATVLRETVAALSAPAPTGVELPPLFGGMVGFLSYDFVRRFEALPTIAEDDLHQPELGMMLATDLVVLDHFQGQALLVANAILPEDGNADDAALTAAYHQAIGRLDAMTTALSRPTPPMVSTVEYPGAGEVTCRTPEGGYRKAVEEAKEAIRAGECFQIVVAQRFERPTKADPLDVYRVLRTTNPSPYMYFLRYDDFDIVGSSPEVHVKVSVGADGTRRALLHPIAGTRWRGETPEADAALAADLLADPKERSEHVMLVDLARNDLGRVCKPGTVDVPEFATVERYSHVMHISSTVVGELTDERSAFDTLAATFPAGTLSGAPKVRAMEIIEELEPTRRGTYGGVVGYFGFGGDMDTAIAIRTAVISGGIAYVQAGAGIVADSDPVAEDTESRNKAAAVLAAIAAAETLRPGEMNRRGAAAKGTRRALALAVVACAAGAALVLVAVSRTWAEIVQARPAPLPPIRDARTGAALFPWLPALALAALAGAGALPATRRAGRVAVGVLLVACGLGIVVGSVAALAGADTIAGAGGVGLGVGGTAPGWTALCGLGGLAVAASGGVAAARGRDWPSLGARYDRPDVPALRGGRRGDGRPTDTQLWDALDHGQDPTRESRER